jgi:hypothetical protein
MPEERVLSTMKTLDASSNTRGIPAQTFIENTEDFVLTSGREATTILKEFNTAWVTLHSSFLRRRETLIRWALPRINDQL